MSITRVISMALSLTLVLLVYSSFSISGVFALPPDPRWGNLANCTYGSADPGGPLTCCWRERVPGQILGERYCQTCTLTSTGTEECDQKELQFFETSTTPTTTPSPTSPFRPPTGGVFDQPTTTTSTTPPPLFGRNAPLQGGGVFGQQPPATAIVPPTPVLTPVPPVLTPEPPVPMFGSTQQATPTPPPQFGQMDPETQVLPPLADDPAFPQGGVLEQPSAQDSEEQSSEEDGQVIAKDEDEDDDDGPVPPECPTTGPIPPDCTLKPKFPDERAIE